MIDGDYAKGVTQGMSREDAIKEMVYHPAWAILVEEFSEIVENLNNGLNGTVRDFAKDISEIRYVAGQGDGARALLERMNEWEEHVSQKL